MDSRAAEVLESLVQRPSELAYIVIADLKDDLLTAVEGDGVSEISGRIFKALASLMKQQQDADTLTACLQYMQEATPHLAPENAVACLQLILGEAVLCIWKSEVAAHAEEFLVSVFQQEFAQSLHAQLAIELITAVRCNKSVDELLAIHSLLMRLQSVCDLRVSDVASELSKECRSYIERLFEPGKNQAQIGVSLGAALKVALISPRVFLGTVKCHMDKFVQLFVDCSQSRFLRVVTSALKLMEIVVEHLAALLIGYLERVFEVFHALLRDPRVACRHHSVRVLRKLMLRISPVELAPHAVMWCTANPENGDSSTEGFLVLFTLSVLHAAGVCQQLGGTQQLPHHVLEEIRMCNTPQPVQASDPSQSRLWELAEVLVDLTRDAQLNGVVDFQGCYFMLDALVATTLLLRGTGNIEQVLYRLSAPSDLAQRVVVAAQRLEFPCVVNSCVITAGQSSFDQEQNTEPFSAAFEYLSPNSSPLTEFSAVFQPGNVERQSPDAFTSNGFSVEFESHNSTFPRTGSAPTLWRRRLSSRTPVSVDTAYNSTRTPESDSLSETSTYIDSRGRILEGSNQLLSAFIKHQDFPRFGTPPSISSPLETGSIDSLSSVPDPSKLAALKQKRPSRHGRLVKSAGLDRQSSESVLSGLPIAPATAGGLLRNTSVDTIDSLEDPLSPAQQAWRDLQAVPDTPQSLRPPPRARRAQTQDDVATAASSLNSPLRHKAHSEADMSLTRSIEVDYLERSQIERSPDVAAELTQLSATLGSTDWAEIFEMLNSVRRLSLHHSDVIYDMRQQIVVTVVEHIRSLRSAVAKNALLTAGDMFFGLKRELDAEVNTVVTAICKRFMDSSNFLIKAAQNALLDVICNATESKTLATLLTYVEHRNPGVRANVVRGIAALLRHAGPSLQGTRELQKLLETMTKISQDSNGDVRAGARKVIRCLAMDVQVDQSSFEQYVPANSLRMAMRESDESPIENGLKERRRRQQPSPSPRIDSPIDFPRKQPGAMVSRRQHASPRPLSTTPSSEQSESGGVEQLSNLYRKLAATDWRDRIQGVTSLSGLILASHTTLKKANKLAQAVERLIEGMEDSNSKVAIHAANHMVDIVAALPQIVPAVAQPLLQAVLGTLPSSSKQLANKSTTLFEQILCSCPMQQYIQLYVSLAEFGSHKVQRVAIQHFPDVIAKAVEDGKQNTIHRVIIPALRRISENSAQAESKANADTMLLALNVTQTQTQTYA